MRYAPQRGEPVYVFLNDEDIRYFRILKSGVSLMLV